MPLQKNLLNRIHELAVFRRRVRVISRRLAEEMDEGTVLDVGCGDGSIAASVMSINSRLEFKGIDVFLRPRIAIPAEPYDGKTIPFENKSFDWVTIIDVLHHTDDPRAILGECMRVSRKGIVIKDHLREGFGADTTLRFMDWVGNAGHGVRLPYNYQTKSQWQQIFESLGLTPISWTQNLGLYRYPASLLFDRNLHFVTTLTT